jgi:amidase
MARTASDLELALDVAAGPDDAEAMAYQLVMPPPRHVDLKNFRVFVLDHHPLLPAAGVVRTALDNFVDRLAKLGCKMGRTSPLLPALDVMGRLYMQLLMAFLGADFPPEGYRRLQAAQTLSPDDVSLPSARLRGSIMSHRDWIKTDRIRASIAHQWRQFFREWDVLVCPVMPTPAFLHDHSDINTRRVSIDGKQIAYADQALWPGLATLAGLPATAMPIGSSDDGLPIGTQIVGPYLEDRTTMAFAALAEREFGGFRPPPAFKH